MANYLYNGVELPELPAYDREAYPYAVIFRSQNRYIFWCVRTCFVIHTDGAVLAVADDTWISYACTGKDGAWETASIVPDEGYTHFSICEKDDLAWSNVDIYTTASSGQVVAFKGSEPVPVPLPFVYDKESFLAGLACGLCGRDGVVIPTKHSYNGTVLPTLPEWDKSVYPYASLVQYPDGLIRLFISSREGYVYDGILSQPDSVSFSNDEPGGNAELDSESMAWGELWFADNAVANAQADWVLWSNHDIFYGKNYDDPASLAGTLFLSASEPEPVYE